MRKMGITLLSCCLAVAVLPTVADDSRHIGKANSSCKKAERSMRSGNLDRAKAQYEKALELVPGFPLAQIGLGQIDMTTKEFASALSHFEMARDGYADLGNVLQDVRSRRYAEAQSQIVQIQDQIQHLRTRAPGPTASIEASRLENQIERLRAVEPPTEESTGEPPGEIFFYIGNAQFQLGELANALTSWKTCAERSPKFAMVHNNLALAYWKTGDLDRAMASLRRAEELGFPVNPDFKRDLQQAHSDSRS